MENCYLFNDVVASSIQQHYNHTRFNFISSPLQSLSPGEDSNLLFQLNIY